MRRADLFFNVLRLPVDFVMLMAAGIVTYLLRTRILDFYRPVLFEFNLPLFRYLAFVVVVAGIFLLSYAIAGLYSMKTRMRAAEEFGKVVIASSAGIMLVIIYIFAQQTLFNSRFLVVGGWLFAILFVTLGRLLVRSYQRYLASHRQFGVHRMLLIGNDEISNRLAEGIERDPGSGYKIVHHLRDFNSEGLGRLVEELKVDEVLLGNPNYSEDKITELVDFCHEHHLIFKFVPNMYQTLTRNFDMAVLYQTPIIELKRTPLDGWGRVAKRIVDLGGAGLGLIFLSPLFLVVSLAIKLDTRGPVLVRLRRVSRNREIWLLKFRSMIAADPDGSADSLKASLMPQNERQDGPLFKMKNDPRITRVGRFIRKFRIDELPQLWNVIQGNLSLIGPRPHQPDEIAQYQKHHKKLLAIKAGCSGLAQISGSSDLPFEEEVTLDTFYIENWSLWLDFKIILKTAWKMLHDRSAV